MGGRKKLKNRFGKITVPIITFLIVIAFSFNIADSTVFARGGSKTKSSTTTTRSTPKTTTKTTPKSGAKSGSFSNTKPSSSNTTNKPSSSTGSRVSGGSTWHMPTVIFWPHRTLYYDAYGISHYRYGAASIISGIVDVIIFLAIIAFIIWLIKRRR
jgi:hypothetical protein